jgi:hypothetical protein
MSFPRIVAVVFLLLALAATVSSPSHDGDPRPVASVETVPGGSPRAVTAKAVTQTGLKLTKAVGGAPAKQPLVLPAFAPVVGSLDPRIRAGYELAAARAGAQWPECNLRWTILAGVGAVETANGAHHEQAVVTAASGVVLPPILGPVLDGTAGHARILDSDGGALDGDAVHDRAVGPMQFLPSTWQRNGRDANDDGVADPHSIDDAAFAAAAYLCRAGDLADDEALGRALFSYNHSDSYVATVRAQIAQFDAEFGFLTFATVTPPPPPFSVAPPSPDDGGATENGTTTTTSTSTSTTSTSTTTTSTTTTSTTVVPTTSSTTSTTTAPPETSVAQ